MKLILILALVASSVVACQRKNRLDANGKPITSATAASELSGNRYIVQRHEDKDAICYIVLDSGVSCIKK